MARKRTRQKTKKTPVAKVTVTDMKGRLENKEMFRQFAFDKRRYSPFSIQELDHIIGICNAVIERKKKSELRSLEKKKQEIDKQIEELKENLK